jgi:hypothetical protein
MQVPPALVNCGFPTKWVYREPALNSTCILILITRFFAAELQNVVSRYFGIVTGSVYMFDGA